MRRGLFITIEGADGSGKTTQIQKLHKLLTANQPCPVVLTREPGGTELGTAIRGLLLDPQLKNKHPIAELLLFNAARADHVSKVILPALKQGAIVLCDRFTDSTWAYQMAGRELFIDQVERAVHLGSLGLYPDLTLILDVDPEVALSRMDARGNHTHFDQESAAFRARVVEAYRNIGNGDPRRYALINGNRQSEQVFSDLCAIVSPKISIWRKRVQSKTSCALDDCKDCQTLKCLTEGQ